MRTPRDLLTAGALSIAALASPLDPPRDPLWLPEDGGGRRIEYEVSTNEVCVLQGGLEAVVPMDRVRGGMQTLTTAAEWNWVLYPKRREHSPGNQRILTSRVVARLRPGADPGAMVETAGAARYQTIVWVPARVVFHSVSGAGEAMVLAERLARCEGVLDAYPVLARVRQARYRPNDPLLSQQWGLANTGQNGASAGVDINALAAWDRATGAGVRIAIVDDGVAYTHPDLAANCRPDLGYDYRSNDPDPAPEGAPGADSLGRPLADSHGTATAGIAGAVGDNSRGVVGAAFRATLVPIRLIGGPVGDDQEAQALSHRAELIDVSNNSWGGVDDGRTIGGLGELTGAAMEHAAMAGRGGRGTIFVWAGGNGAESGDNSNYDSYANSIHALAVGAVNDLGLATWYSEPGANLSVCAPGGDDLARPQAILTTDLPGEYGFNRTGAPNELADPAYTRTFGGTSAAAPFVSGTVALMLEVNSTLALRDVREILFRTAVKTDPRHPGWFTNAAGFHFNPYYGAGRVDAGAAVAMAGAWTNLPPGTNWVGSKTTKDLIPIPDAPAPGVEYGFDLGESPFRVELVTVDIDIEHPRRGQLSIVLKSPAGTSSVLFEPHSDPNPDLRHKFMSVMCWGEPGQGRWTLTVTDRQASSAGSIAGLTLRVQGIPLEVVAPSLAIQRLEDGACTVAVYGVPPPAGIVWMLQRSPDLKRWTDLGIVTPLSEGSQWVDRPPSEGENAWFYRTRSQSSGAAHSN